MPRIRPAPGMGGDGVRGYRAPGLYASLLEAERGRCGEVDPRWRHTAAGHEGEPAPEHYRRSRRLLDALEAGKTVKVPLPWAKKWPLPWKRPDVTAVTVTPDDLVRPADDEFVWPGVAVHEKGA